MICGELSVWWILPSVLQNDKAPLVGRQTVSIAQRGGRAAREATVVLRATHCMLSPPRHRQDAGPALPLNIVLVQETAPPANVKPLCWRLLTSESIETPAQVAEVVR